MAEFQRWSCFNVRLEKEKYERLRRAAFEKRISLAEIIRQAVNLWLEKEERKKWTGP